MLTPKRTGTLFDPTAAAGTSRTMCPSRRRSAMSSNLSAAPDLGERSELSATLPPRCVEAKDRSPLRADSRRGYQASCVDDPVEARAIWYVPRGRVRSCVRPTLRGPVSAGPDAIRSLAPKQIYALEWRITLDGFFQAPGSTGSLSRHHRPHSPVSCGNR